MMSRPLFSVEKVRWFRYESSGLLPVGHITRDDPRNGQYRNVLDVFHLLWERTPLAKNSLYFILNNDWFIGWSKLNLWHYDSS